MRLRPSSTAPLGSASHARTIWCSMGITRTSSQAPRAVSPLGLHETALALPELVYRERVVQPCARIGPWHGVHFQIAVWSCACDVRSGGCSRQDVCCDHARRRPIPRSRRSWCTRVVLVMGVPRHVAGLRRWSCTVMGQRFMSRRIRDQLRSYDSIPAVDRGR